MLLSFLKPLLALKVKLRLHSLSFLFLSLALFYLSVLPSLFLLASVLCLWNLISPQLFSQISPVGAACPPRKLLSSLTHMINSYTKSEFSSNAYSLPNPSVNILAQYFHNSVYIFAQRILFTIICSHLPLIVGFLLLWALWGRVPYFIQFRLFNIKHRTWHMVHINKYWLNVWKEKLYCFFVKWWSCHVSSLQAKYALVKVELFICIFPNFCPFNFSNIAFFSHYSFLVLLCFTIC